MVSVYGKDFKDVVFDNTLEFHYRNYSKDYRSYSHDLETFISKNKEGIVEWLKLLVSDFKISATDRIIILSPCHELTNLTFVNLVNDVVFGSSATMVNLEPEKEFPENFKRMNRDFLAPKAATRNRIFFVDDNLVTGRTFFSIYDLFRYSSGYGGVVLSGSIFLMNKASARTNERVVRASSRVHSYVAINQPLEYDNMDENPVTRKIASFKSMMNRCCYYHEEIAFKNKLKRFDEYDVKSRSPKEEERYLKLFLSTHALFQFFGGLQSVGALDNLSLSDVFDSCYSSNKRVDDRMTVIKALTQSSFTMYQPLRTKIFEWLKKEVKDQVDGFYNLSNEYEYKLECLLFVISRSVRIKNYWIVSSEFFRFLAGIFNMITKKGTMWAPSYGNSDSGTLISSIIPRLAEYAVPEGFFEKIVRYYVELILNNGACAVMIQSNLDESEFTTQPGKDFCKALQDESFIVLDDLFEYIRAIGFFETFPPPKDYSKIKMDVFINDVINWLKVYDVLDSSRFEIAERIAGLTRVQLSQKVLTRRFAEFFLTKSFLRTENRNERPVKEKTEFICEHVKRLVSTSVDDVGSFFIIKDVLGKLRLVYDKDSKGISVLENQFDNPSVVSFFDKLSEPLSSNGDLVLDYSAESASSCPFISSIDGCKQLYVYKIASVKEDTVAGFMGFYSSTNSLDDDGRRYMLLIRRDLCDFISRHYRNEEFIQWILTEERQRFAHLSGHGREVMIQLGWKKKSFRSVVGTLERLQSIFVVESIDPSSIQEHLDQSFPLRDITHADAEEIIQFVKTIAADIYQSEDTGDIVEIRENAELGPFQVEGSGKVYFHPDLIKFICFELIINAKKNRFQVVENVFPSLYGTKTFSNQLSTRLCFSSTGLTIEVSGTGPMPNQVTMNRINGGTSIKRKEDISGLDLITKLIKKYDSDNSIWITKQELTDPKGIYMNTVVVKLFYKRKT